MSTKYGCPLIQLLYGMSNFSILLMLGFTWHATWFIFRKGYRRHFYFLLDQSHSWWIPFAWSHSLVERPPCRWRVASSRRNGGGCTNWCFVYWPPCDRGASPFSLFCCHFCFLSLLPGGCSLSHLLHQTIFSIRTEAMNCPNSCTTAATLNWRIPLKESEFCFGLLAVR